MFLSGYSSDNRLVLVYLENERVIIEDFATGEKTRWNDEYYSEEDEQLVRCSMMNEGYRF